MPPRNVGDGHRLEGGLAWEARDLGEYGLLDMVF